MHHREQPETLPDTFRAPQAATIDDNAMNFGGHERSLHRDREFDLIDENLAQRYNQTKLASEMCITTSQQLLARAKLKRLSRKHSNDHSGQRSVSG